MEGENELGQNKDEVRAKRRFLGASEQPTHKDLAAGELNMKSKSMHYEISQQQSCVASKPMNTDMAVQEPNRDMMQNELNRTLERALDNAASIITKSYLDNLESYEVLAPSTENEEVKPNDVGAFYKLKKIVWNREESFLDKLTTIVNVVYSIRSSLVTVVTSDGGSIEYYVGILSKEFRSNYDKDKQRRSADRKAFAGALSGNMIGSDIESISDGDLEDLQAKMFGKEGDKSIASVSGIVSLRDEEKFTVDSYVQGIENLVDSLRGMKYTILMIADPISTSEVQVIKQGYEMLHTQLSVFRGSSLTMSENDALSLSKARTEGITKGLTKGLTTGIAMTQSKSTTTGKSKSWGINGGVNMGVPFVVGINVGGSYTRGTNTGETNTSGRTDSTSESNQQSNSDTKSVGTTKTMGKSWQVNYENRTVRALLDKIDRHLERLDNCESFGTFNCASYCLADTKEEALAVASNYNAIFRGKNSSIQSSHINTWERGDDKAKLIHRYLHSYTHPRFYKKEEKNNEKHMIVSPASIISGNELAIQVGFPKKSVNGVTVIPMAAFGRNMPVSKDRGLPIGKLYHMGRTDGGMAEVKLDMESLTMHTFITGSTGAGKSNTIYRMIEKLVENHVGFLVIEPAKGEYKDIIGKKKGVITYGTNPNIRDSRLLRMNPFRFPAHTHVLEHLDRLVEIFNVCWPMYAAMPAILKDSVERAYVKSGWDLEKSVNRYSADLFPTFDDIVKEIKQVLNESDYSSDNKGDYIGSLVTRLRSLTNGINGLIFSTDDLKDEELFEQNVIVDLSRVGSSETKSLIMGLLVLKLQEHRMEQRSKGANVNDSLKHVTILEEAHNLLKRTSTEQPSEGANLLGKSVEMLANSIAEMRTYGEGFIIADQSPGLLDMSVIRNTNTKIILRLPDLGDRELVGRASGLNDNQIVELARLEKGVAAISQSNWLEPVLCKIDKYDGIKETLGTSDEMADDARERVDNEVLKQSVLDCIMTKEIYRKGDKMDIRRLKDDVLKSRLDTTVKCEFLDYVSSDADKGIGTLRKFVYDFFMANEAVKVSEKYSNINDWVHSVVDNLSPKISGYSKEQIDLVMALLVDEQSRRDVAYADLFKKFTEVYKIEGGVF